MVKTFIDGKLLPVNPLEDVTLNYKSGNKTVELVELGEATLLGTAPSPASPSKVSSPHAVIHGSQAVPELLTIMSIILPSA